MTEPLHLAPSRRAVLVGMGLASLVGCTTTGQPPLPSTRIRSVRVDVSPLAAKGVSNWATLIGSEAEKAVPTSFAGLLAPTDRSAPDLVLKVTDAWLVPYTGGAGFFGDIDTFDWIEGTLALGGTSRPSEIRKIVVRLSPSISGPWYVADIDEKRSRTLARAFVAEARRMLGA